MNSYALEATRNSGTNWVRCCAITPAGRRRCSIFFGRPPPIPPAGLTDFADGENPDGRMGCAEPAGRFQVAARSRWTFRKG